MTSGSPAAAALTTPNAPAQTASMPLGPARVRVSAAVSAVRCTGGSAVKWSCNGSRRSASAANLSDVSDSTPRTHVALPPTRLTSSSSAVLPTPSSPTTTAEPPPASIRRTMSPSNSRSRCRPTNAGADGSVPSRHRARGAPSGHAENMPAP